MYRKELFYRGLNQLPVYIEDTLPNSPYYFNIVDIPKVFGPGKNSIRFNLNENNLDIYNNVDVEIIDSYGNTVYHEAPEYSQSDEANIRVLTVYLYDNISNGPLTITFVGHALIGLNGEPIPSEFQNKYSVRYTTIVDFNRFQKNTSRILFSQDPSISISEKRTAYVSRSFSSTNTVTVSGSGIYRFQQSYPLLELPQEQSFINDMLNATLVLTGSSFLPDFSGYVTSSFNIFNSRVSNIFNSQVAILNTPWSTSISGFGSTPSFGLINSANVNYTLTYNPTPTYTPTNNFKSFINLQIANLEPASGYLKYIKLYGKSQGSLDQYELLGESTTVDNELLINSSSLVQYDRSNVGYFLNSSSFQSFWNYNNTYLSASFNTSSLFNSLYLNPQVDPTTTDVLFTSNIDINFQKESSYRLYFNYVKNTNFILEVYMSGSAFIDKTGIGQKVFYLDSTNFGPSYLNFPIDFLAPQTGTGRLQFKILAGSFYISDISLKSGPDQGFNPSNFNSYFPINVKNRDDVYDFKVELIDDNGQINSYEFDNTAPFNVQITGSNQYIGGNDNVLPGRINLGSSPDGGVSLDGNTNTVSTYGYTGGEGWTLWSGSREISGSIQSGSGFYFETGAPNNQYFKAVVGGKIESNAFPTSSGDPIDTGSFVKKDEFYQYTSSVQPLIDQIPNKLDKTTFNNYTSSVQPLIDQIPNKLDKDVFYSYTSSNDIAVGNKLDKTIFYNFTESYNSDSSSLDTRINNKLDKTVFNSYTSSTDPKIKALLKGVTNLNSTLTFTRDDNTTFDVTTATDKVSSGPFNAFTESINNKTGLLLKTGSVSLNTLTFTKDDGTSFNLTVNTGSIPTTDTGSLLVTGSANPSNSDITFTKGDGTTFTITTANDKLDKDIFYQYTGSVDPLIDDIPNKLDKTIFNSYTSSTDNAVNNKLDKTIFYNFTESINNKTGLLLKTGSVSLNTLTFTKDDGTTFNLTVNTGSGTTTDTGSLMKTGSANPANSNITFTKGDGTTFTITTANDKANLSGGNTFTGDQTINGKIIISGSDSAFISNTGRVDLPGGSTTTTVYQYEGTSYVGGLFNIHIQKSPTQFSLYNMIVANDTSGTDTTYNIIASASFGDEVNTNTTIIADTDGGTKTRIRITNDDSADYSVRIFPTLIST